MFSTQYKKLEMDQSCKHIMTTLRTSRNYIMFSLLQVLISLVILAYIVADPSTNMQEGWVMVLEFFLTVIIMIDIIIRLVAEGKSYFDSIWNIVDLIAFVLIVIFMGTFYLLILSPDVSIDIEETDDIFGLLLIIAYYGLQFARIVFLIKQSHKASQMRGIHDIQFDNQEGNQVSKNVVYEEPNTDTAKNSIEFADFAMAKSRKKAPNDRL